MKVFTGKVISTKMQKTATVAVGRVTFHKLYKKRFKVVKKYHVHDEIGVSVGQTVNFVASKPYSKLKKWKVIKVVNAKEQSVKALKPEVKSAKPEKVKRVVKTRKIGKKKD